MTPPTPHVLPADQRRRTRPRRPAFAPRLRLIPGGRGVVRFDLAACWRHRQMLARLEDAVRTLLSSDATGARPGRRRETLAWLLRNDWRHPLAYERVCAALGLDATRLRKRILRTARGLGTLALAAALLGSGAARAAGADVASVAAGSSFIGEASWYGDAFAHRPTASGERFDPAALTCAHRTLPLGTRLRITNLRTGRAVVVRINDRGPYVGARVLDLSFAAAAVLGMVERGVEPVLAEPL